MVQDRLSNLAIIEINSDYLSKLDITKIINAFVIGLNVIINF